MSKLYWTKERCLEIAKDCKSRGELKKKNDSAYQSALRNKWIDEYSWFLPSIKNIYSEKIDLVYVYVFPNNVAYIGRTMKIKERHWEHSNRIERDVVAKYVHENNLIIPEPIILEKDLTLNEGLEREKYWVNYYKNNGYKLLNSKPCGINSGSLGSLGRGKWTKKKTLEEAKKYKSKSEFRKNCDVGYQTAYKNGWLKDYVWFKRPIVHNKIWTEEKCMKAAKNCSSIKEFRTKYITAYYVSKKNGWFKEYNWLKNANDVKWTKERCIEEAKKYTTKSAFRVNSESAYNKCINKKWLKEISELVWGQNP